MSPFNSTTVTQRLKDAAVTVANGLAKTKIATRGDRSVIIDIRREEVGFSLEEDIINGLKKEAGQRTLPTLLLYSAEGLKLFEEITYLDDIYYLTETEIKLLEECSARIAERIVDGSVIVELGSGNLRKVNILLKAIDTLGKKVDYYALDLDRSELERTFSLLDTSAFQNVRFFGLHGTYEDGRAWLKDHPQVKDKPRCVLWLGSSLGNFDLKGAAEFLRGFASDVLRAGKPDYMLVGIDGCKIPEKVYTAYNDPAGITEKFIKAGLRNANEILGSAQFRLEDWDYVGEWNAQASRHQAYLVPRKDITFSGVLSGLHIAKGERVNIEYSYKFDDKEAEWMWGQAGLVEGAQWANRAGDYYLHLLSKPKFSFGTTPAEYAPYALPTIEEWKQLWVSWDTVTLGMIPKDQLISKPIDLRNPCIFYLGHIPTFLDNLIVKASGVRPTEPASYVNNFLRGIDPDVDNPEQCHSHSELPECWPELHEVLGYINAVRERVQELYGEGPEKLSPLLKRALWTGFEHEVMHLETLLYMLLQSEHTLPPPGIIEPDFVFGKARERRSSVSEADAWVQVPAARLTVGLEDPEEPEVVEEHHFGWDNEKPSRQVSVDGFSARTYPITNEEYATFLHATSRQDIPASWTHGDTEAVVNGSSKDDRNFLKNKFVRTVFGPVPLELALDWPAIASYDELSECAKWLGGYIPTANQVQVIYHVAEQGYEKKISRMIDAVNGHLINNGVCETPPRNLFADVTGRNVGFLNWHPTSVRSVATGKKLLGRGETGGAWEWTSTVLERHEGFQPAKLYPEYTADFFDGKHNIVLGGSWATHPRIAGRKSFVNWYQRNYRYTWATARIVKD